MTCMSLKWSQIPLDPRQVGLAHVLRCGQSFRWRNIDGVWSIGMKNRVLLLKQDDKHLSYASVGPGLPTLTDEDLVKDYFNLHVDLEHLYKQWSNDKRFHGRLHGIRILRQDPWECLCAFICSSNNNIKRISKMVDSLCTKFGKFIAHHDGQDYYDFPTPADLADPAVEQKLRDLGFGYRAKYINATAQKIEDLPQNDTYLHSLRESPYPEAHKALLGFMGVGPKVADCVCLMSLDKHDCVPVDTHVWQIATRDYKMKVKNSPQGHREIQEKFQALWGEYAGWAHSVLFAGDLSDLNNGINIKREEANKNIAEPDIKPLQLGKTLDTAESRVLTESLNPVNEYQKAVKTES